MTHGAAVGGVGQGVNRRSVIRRPVAVPKQHHAPGMPAEVYDQVAAGAMPSQNKSDGTSNF